MKKISMQRTLFELINLILAAFFVLPVAALLERLLFEGSPVLLYSAVSCLAALGYIAGRISMGRTAPVAAALCFGTAIIAALAVALTISGGAFPMVLFILVTFGLDIFLFFVARTAGYSVHAPFAVTGIIIYLVVMIILTYCGRNGAQEACDTIGTFGMVFFLLSLYAFNAKGLRKSLHKDSTAKTVRYPAGMQKSNFLLITGFIIIAILVSKIYPLFSVFVYAATFLVGVFFKVMAFIRSLFNLRTGGAVADDTASDPSTETIYDMMPEYNENPFEMGVFYVVVALCIMGLLAYFLIWLYKFMKKRIHGMPAFLRKIADAFGSPTDDYVDETENLLDWDMVKNSVQDKLREMAKKITERPQRIEDMPDNRMKVRFAYKELLKKVTAKLPGAIYDTPYELMDYDMKSTDEKLGSFIESYTIARYSEEEIGPDDAELAKEIIKKYT